MPPTDKRTTTTPLGHREERYWPADPTAPPGGQRGGAYEVFIPDPIAEREFTLDSGAVAAIAEATKALGRLNDTRPQLASLAALARNLLRSESAASSRIEGVKISHRRLARAAYARAGSRRGDNRAAEVLGNVEAMERAIELGASTEPFTVTDIQDIHRTLLRFTDDRDIAGVIRTKQSWIGGNDYHPVGAPYVPPPHEQVAELLDDLCRFIARTDVAAVAQAAIAHAQFENIHPFVDGNGRTGRALIYTVLRRRGEVSNYIPPISLVLAGQPKNYVGGLGAYSQGKVGSWCERFAHATARAAREAERLAEAIEGLQATWLERLGQPRRDAAVREIVGALPAQPVIDVVAAQRLTGKSHVAVGNAISQLEEAGVLQKLNERKWGRVWECGELLTLVETFERGVSTP
ncbi:MAG: Fic family protein [Solirubrobacteraceae bacterium]